MKDPQLIVFRIKKGSRILVGDSENLSARELQKIQSLADRFNCQTSEDKRDRPFDNSISAVVGVFRSQRTEICRKLIIESSIALGIQAITYPFYSVSLKDCRTTGTAINIIDFNSVALDEINWHSQSLKIEGNPALTPFVKALFDEGKDDYHSQLFLHSFENLENYRRGFHFFDNTPTPNAREYKTWKESHIYKCGPKWSSEVSDSRFILFRNLRFSSDLALQQLMIQTSIAFGSRFQDPRQVLPSGSNSEMNFSKLHAIERMMGQISTDPKGSSNYSSHLTKLVKDIKNIPRGSQKSPRALLLLVMRLGLDPQTSREIYSQIALQSGMAPLFTGTIYELNENFETVNGANTEKLSKILSKCLGLYQDQSITNQEIYDGECGVNRKD